MNQAQRTFLINKIKERTKSMTDALKKEDREDSPPSLSNYLLHAVMSDKFQLQDIETIKKTIKEKALTAKMGGSIWLGKSSWQTASDNEVVLKADQLFVIPEEWRKQWEIYRKEQDERQSQINEIQIQSDTLITRIQLASDKTLEKMISEIDDMGNISLMDTKLKILQGGTDTKQIQ